MSLGNQVTDLLNRIESFCNHAPVYWFPVKLLGWLVLLIALMATNVLAMLNWPVSAVIKRLKKKSSSSGEPIDVATEQQLEDIIAKHDVVLVDFWAQWCGPCLLMHKAVTELANEQAGKVTVVKVDVSINSTLSKRYSVRGLPTIIVYKQGSEVTRKSGSLTKNQLLELTLS